MLYLQDHGEAISHLVHVHAIMGEREGDLAGAHGLGEHLPRLPLGLVDLVVHEVAQARVLAAHQQLSRAIRPELLRRDDPESSRPS